MAGSKSDYLSRRLLDHVLGGPAFVPPATVYFALFLEAPSDLGGGLEVSGGSYGRVSAANDAVTWSSALSSLTPEKKTNFELVFPLSSDVWGTILAYAIFDASTGGNILYWGNLTTPRTVIAGRTVKFQNGDLTILED